jgi:putative methyltransferase (TIGR04325 family)
MKARFERLARAAGDLPGVWHLRRAAYERQVRRGLGWQFWGTFPTRSAAEDAARQLGHLPVGYDQPGAAQHGRATYEQMHSFDYPALVAIARAVQDGCRHVVDLGGHLGAKYRAYSRLWRFPDEFRWTVCETSAVVAAAQELPQVERLPGLSFTTDRDCLRHADLLFASGVLQYLETGLPAVLGELPVPPRRLVLNKVPLSHGPEVWTIQRAGPALVPYHVMNRAQFLSELRQLGYSPVDFWKVTDYAARIPFARGYGTESNSGLALERI